MEDQHTPVLLEEVITGLAIKPDGCYVDATFGRGGHSQAILNCLGRNGQLIALDKDPAAVAYGKELFLQDARFSIEQASFANMNDLIVQRMLQGHVSGVLMDLGVSSPQIDDPRRGFSFSKDGPLDMRMDTTQSMTAALWLNTADEADIRTVLKEYGEERFSKRIANAIIRRRETCPLSSTAELATLVAAAVPFCDRYKHPATRTFQGIRIFINRELDDLKKGLQQSMTVLANGGRLCVISFHSLEDRIVKRFIQREAMGESLPRGLPIKEDDIEKRVVKIGKLVIPSESELKQNPRARSARLRIAERQL